MAIVTEISWDAMFDGQPVPESPVRAAWRAAVAEVAERAKAALPVEVNGRVEQAMQMVLNGDVDLLPDGTATVASQRDGAEACVVVNGTCPCPDCSTAPAGWCTHRISAALAKRAHALAKAKLEAATDAPAGTPPPQGTPALPHEQPTTSTDIAPQFMIEGASTSRASRSSSFPGYWPWRIRVGW